MVGGGAGDVGVKGVGRSLRGRSESVVDTDSKACSDVHARNYLDQYRMGGSLNVK